jgi:hypothetical protein
MGSLLDQFLGHNKSAGDAVLSYAMHGRLYISGSGWGLLSVPNSLVRGVFDAMSEPGIELPPSGKNDDKLNAHLSVFRKEEIESIGGPDKITERGHDFSYTLGPVRTMVPDGWSAMSRVWVIEVRSPELEALRKGYGLTGKPNNGKYDFHITVAVKRKHVGFENTVSKGAEASPVLMAPSETSEAYYHGSPNKGLTELNPGSYVTQDPQIAHVMGMYYPDTGDTWKDSDLSEPYGWHGEPSWAEGRKPTGVPSVYRFNAKPEDLEHLGSGDYESRTIAPVAVERHSDDSERQALFHQLRTAHLASKARDYGQKMDILRRLMQQYPDQFIVDDPTGHYHGITHAPTNFRYHVPPTSIPNEVRYPGVSKAAEVLKKKGVWPFAGDYNSSWAGKAFGQIQNKAPEFKIPGTEDNPLSPSLVSPPRSAVSKRVLPGENALGWKKPPDNGAGPFIPAPAQSGVQKPSLLGSMFGDKPQRFTTDADLADKSVKEWRNRASHPDALNQREMGGPNSIFRNYQDKGSWGDIWPSYIPGSQNVRPPSIDNSKLEKFSEEVDEYLLKEAEEIPGISSRGDYGDPSKLRVGEIYTLLSQMHDARRAGQHHDIRIGNPDIGLLSWASRKGLPEPGGKHLAIQQPLHDWGYKDFQGDIASGYGAGSVKKEFERPILVTKVEPDKISFSTADKKHPERFSLIRTSHGWLALNTTLTGPTGYQKLHYKKVDPGKMDEILSSFQPGTSVQAKIDGASSLIRLAQHNADVLSYRTSRMTGNPISHTERVFGGSPQIDLPPEYAGSVLKGELYGVRDGKAIHPSETSALLNSGLAESLRKQKERNVKLRNAVYDIQQLGKTPVDFRNVPYSERRQMLEKIMPYLPEDTFHLTPEATTPEEASQLWEGIRTGQNPLSHEGVVIHPPSGVPIKSKLHEDADVWIRGVFPGEGKYQGTGAGGFEYSSEPQGPVLGRVGTGLSDEVRRQMWQTPNDYVGRVAKIRAQEKLPSGAYRAPAFLSLHEDETGIPAEKAAAVGCKFSRLRDTLGYLLQPGHEE